MLILTLRTDKPEAELGLHNDRAQLAHVTWQAHRQLAETIHTKLQELLTSASKQLADLQAIVIYEGPGSFTGLRIGMSVANALAYSYHIPVIAKTGDDWVNLGIKAVLSGQKNEIALPHYGAEVHITLQKK